ncbi:MAG: DHA2 family efflux MFS transporter permease subunit [Thermodesulfobacteriota bacterium]|jgi:EmrB/QacA subfamily drug resistance transporter
MRRYLIFVSAGLGLFMYSVDGTAVAVAFPNFIRDFGTNVLWAAWTISIYLVAVTSVMPLMGKLSDSLGRKKVFLISLILFTTSSLACGLAPNIYILVVFRFLQGIGGASFLPTAAGIVSDEFPEHRERAIGLFTSIFQIGGIVGPNLGGWIVSRYSWRYIFYINLPIGIGLIVLILILLEDSGSFRRPHIDFAGASFFFGAMLFLMLSLNFVAENFSISSLLLTIVFLVVSFSFLYLFSRQEKKDSNPILDVVLLRSKPFLAANLCNMIAGAGVLGVFAFIPLFATSAHGLSTLVSGMILTPRSLAIIPASVATSFLLKRSGYRRPMLLGMIIISFATILLGQEPGLWRMTGIHLGIAESIALIVMVSGVGIGIFYPASNNACIELMPEKVATITGLRGMFANVGGALGISLITIILHLSSTPAGGFRIAFTSFGVGLLLTIPLVFLMPAGRNRNITE